MTKRVGLNTALRIFFLSGLSVNAGIILISIYFGLPALIPVSILISVFLLMIYKRHRLDDAVSGILPDCIQKEQTLYQYLKRILRSGACGDAEDGTMRVLKTFIQVSPNPDPSRKEAVLHAKRPARIKDPDFKVSIGGGRCKRKFLTGIYNMDTGPSPMNKNLIPVLDKVSCAANFYFSSNDAELRQWKKGNLFFKFAVNIQRPQILKKKLEALFAQSLENPAVKGIELVYETGFSSCHSLAEMTDKKNNAYFNNPDQLLRFVKKIRMNSSGCPVGIRTGLQNREPFIKLCTAMKTTGVTLDFITILGEATSPPKSSTTSLTGAQSPMHLEEAVAFASATLSANHLEKEIALCAAGTIDNGFELVKLLALGADYCLNIPPVGTLHKAVGGFFPDDEYLENIFTEKRRVVLSQARQIMEYAGFPDPAHISSKMFFRKVSPSTFKSLEEIYFEKKAGSRNFSEDLVYMNLN